MRRPDFIATASRPAQCAWVIVLGLMIGALPVAVCAQSPDSAESQPASPKPATTTPEQPGQVRPHDTVILIDDKTGLPIRVPAGATIEAIVAEIQRRKEAVNDGTPDYAVSSVFLEGEVTRDDSNGLRAFARLNVRVSVQVLRPDGSVRVPLRLNESTLLDYTHTGAGRVVLLETGPGQGITCLLTGAGRYQFDLTVSLPVRINGGTNRIQLSLPGSVQSSMRLTVPGQGINIPDDDLDARTRALDDAKTELQVNGFGATLDVAWQVAAAPRSVRPELVSQSAQAAELDADGGIIDVAQTITTNRSYDAIEVQPPQGYSFISVSSSTHRGVQIENAEARPLRVLFSATATGTVDLLWEFAATASTAGDPIELGGLLVPGASRQENRLSVSVADGFRLQRVAARMRDIDQIPASRFHSSGESRLKPGRPIDEAWRLLSDTARVAYSVNRVTPSFRVTPTYDLTFRETQAELAMFLDVQVFNGSLERIPLRWPGFESEGWQQVEVLAWRQADGENPEQVDVSATSNGDADDGVELVLKGGQTSAQGLMEIELHCSRPLIADNATFPVSLPGINVLPIPIGKLTTRNAARIESVLEAHRETNARLMPRPRDPVVDGRTPRNQRARVWELNSSRLEFIATVEAREQSIVTESTARLEMTHEEAHVRQSLEYSVSYAAVPAVYVMVPLPVIETQNAEFHLRRPGDQADTGQELTPLLAGLDEETAREFRLELPEPLWGTFSIEVTYSVAIDADTARASATSIPLIWSSDGVPEVSRLQVNRPTSIQVELSDAAWSRELAAGASETWVAAGAPRSAPLNVTISADQATERFSIERAAVRSMLHPAGAQTEAVYVISGRPRRLEMSLPAEADRRSLRIWWDGGPLDPSQVAAAADVPTTLQLRFPDLSDQSVHLLAIRFQSPVTGGFAAVNDFVLAAPTFAPDVWIAETRWTVGLPLGHHALTYPQNYAPRFRWTRTGPLWSRQSAPASGDLRTWLLSGSPGQDGQRTAADFARLQPTIYQLPEEMLARRQDENAYRFGAFGHQNSLTLRTISVPAIAVLGSGASLLIGFVLLRIPATRNILSFGVLAFGMALAGLWQLEAVQLLVQPALLGFALAGTASLIDGWRRRDTLVIPETDPAPQSAAEDFVLREPGSSQLDARQEASDPSQPAPV